MARFRRYRRSRPNANYVWQSYPNAVALSLDTDHDDVKSGQLFSTVMIPGVGSVRDATNLVKPFQNDHILERVVGTMSHNAHGVTSPGAQTWFPFSVAAIKVPKGLTLPADADIDLFDSTEADDFLFRMDAVCNADNASEATPNWHDVNSKSKRKFEVGDAIHFLYSLLSPFTDSSWNIDVAVNLRFLWKLKI